jgi:DNA-binding transcriptional MerR regulator
MISENGQEIISIQEVTETLGVSKSLIRFWEDEFDLPKRANGVVSPLQFDELKLIHGLIAEQELSLEDAKDVFSKARIRLEIKHRSIEKLKTIRQALMDLKQSLTE